MVLPPADQHRPFVEQPKPGDRLPGLEDPRWVAVRLCHLPNTEGGQRLVEGG